MPTGSKSTKKSTYLWVSVIVLVFGVVTIPSLMKRLKSGSVVDTGRMTMSQDAMYPAKDSQLSYIMGVEGPRMIPEFEFTDQNGLVLKSEDLKGRVVVLDFFFTTCPTICPIMSQNMATLIEQFENEPVAFVSITINPFYDTPERLLAYKNRYHPQTEQWYLLTGDREAIYDLALKGFYMIATEDAEAEGGFEHSGLFALIDSNGYFRSSNDEFGNPLIYYRATITPEMKVDSNGETEQISQLASDIAQLLKEDQTL